MQMDSTIPERVRPLRFNPPSPYDCEGGGGGLTEGGETADVEAPEERMR